MTDTLRRATLTAVTGLGLCLTLLPAGQAQAQAPTRVPCNDIAALKTAINNANTNGGSITLAPHCIYTLTAADNTDDGLPEITGKVRITGDRTTVRRAPDATQNFRIFHVAPGGSLTLNSLSVSGGRLATLAGGGIWNSGTLNLNHTSIKANRAPSAGGIHNIGGQLNLEDSTVERNTADRNGGGIINGRNEILDRPGTVTMTGGSLHKNRALTDAGGGLENIRSTAHLNSVSVTGNTAPRGGGINQFVGTLRLKSTTLRDNIAVTGGGLRNSFSTAELVHSLVTHNTAITAGGGIINENSSSVTLTASKVIRNTPDNCSPAGSVPGCTNPTSPATPPSSPTPPPAKDTKNVPQRVS